MMLKRMIALFLALALCAAFPACAETGAPVPMKTVAYADWGLAIDAPAEWQYAGTGKLPPSSNRPFKISTDTLSSRDTFVLGRWTASNADWAAEVRLRVYYTSAGTVERIKGVQDKMMRMYVERTSAATGMDYAAGSFEILSCGAHQWACFSMTATHQGVSYVMWNFVLPFPMTVVHLEGFAPVEGEVDMKQVLMDMAASVQHD